MHQTTVRFTGELWNQLEKEARRMGVSAAQYVRDATLARLAYTAGQRGAGFFSGETSVPESEATTAEDAVEDAAAKARATQDGSAAVWAEARLAGERAEVVRQDARAAQTAHAHPRFRPVPVSNEPIEEHP
jgi:hypothetical protein